MLSKEMGAGNSFPKCEALGTRPKDAVLEMKWGMWRFSQRARVRFVKFDVDGRREIWYAYIEKAHRAAPITADG